MTKAEQQKTEIVQQTISDMERLGVYKPEYDGLISIYCDMRIQYAIHDKKYRKSGYKCAVETESGNSKGSPVVRELQALRKDILAYSDRLCLNPKSIETVTTEKATKSKLVSVLNDLK